MAADADGLGLELCDNCMLLIASAALGRHIQECGSEVWTCPECGDRVSVEDKSIHAELHNTTQRCNACGDTVDAGGHEAHERVCLMQGRQCRWCNSTVPLIEHQLHESLCGCHDEPCSACGRRVMRSMADAHRASGCELHASEAAITSGEHEDDGDDTIDNSVPEDDVHVAGSRAGADSPQADTSCPQEQHEYHHHHHIQQQHHEATQDQHRQQKQPHLQQRQDCSGGIHSGDGGCDAPIGFTTQTSSSTSSAINTAATTTTASNATGGTTSSSAAGSAPACELDADAAAVLAVLSARRSSAPKAASQHHVRGAPSSALQSGYGTQKCAHCGDAVSTMLMDEHDRLCAIVRNATIKQRPFSRGAPLPAVGAQQGSTTTTGSTADARVGSRAASAGAVYASSSSSPVPMLRARSSGAERRLSPARVKVTPLSSSSSSLSAAAQSPKRASAGLFAPLDASLRTQATGRSSQSTTVRETSSSSQRTDVRGRRVVASARHQII